jgi:hypothetical protein
MTTTSLLGGTIAAVPPPRVDHFDWFNPSFRSAKAGFSTVPVHVRICEFNSVTMR